MLRLFRKNKLCPRRSSSRRLPRLPSEIWRLKEARGYLFRASLYTQVPKAGKIGNSKFAERNGHRGLRNRVLRISVCCLMLLVRGVQVWMTIVNKARVYSAKCLSSEQALKKKKTPCDCVCPASSVYWSWNVTNFKVRKLAGTMYLRTLDSCAIVG